MLLAAPAAAGLVPQDVGDDRCGLGEVLVDGRAFGLHCARLDLSVTPECEGTDEGLRCEVDLRASATAERWTREGTLRLSPFGQCGGVAFTWEPPGTPFTVVSRCVERVDVPAGECLARELRVTLTIEGPDAPSPIEKALPFELCA